MIKTTDALINAIKKEIIKKHGSYSLIYRLDFQFWLIEKHKVKIAAWQEKYGSIINNVEFITTLSKDLMRKFDSKFLIFDEVKEERFFRWLYNLKR